MDLFLSDIATVVQLYDAVVAWRERNGQPPCRHLVATATCYSSLLMSAVNSWLREPVVIMNGSDELLIAKKVSLVRIQLCLYFSYFLPVLKQVHHVMEDQLTHTAATLLVGLTEHQWTEGGPVLVCAGSRAQSTGLVRVSDDGRACCVSSCSSRPQLPNFDYCVSVCRDSCVRTSRLHG